MSQKHRTASLRRGRGQAPPQEGPPAPTSNPCSAARCQGSDPSLSPPQSTPPTPIPVTTGPLALPSTQGAPHRPGGPCTPGPHGPPIGSTCNASRVPTRGRISARDDCQQLAGPKTQLRSLSRGQGLGCSSSQGGHSSCNSFQAPRQPWAPQAGTRVGAERGRSSPQAKKPEPLRRTPSGTKEPHTHGRGKAALTTQQVGSQPASQRWGRTSSGSPRRLRRVSQRGGGGRGVGSVSLRQQNGGAPRRLRRAVTTAAFITHHQTAISSPASSLITQPAFSSRFITGINNEFRAWKAIKMCD